MLHHVSLGVRELARAGAFYDAVMGALGFHRVFEANAGIGYGSIGGEDQLYLRERPDAAPPGPGFHLAFAAASRAAVAAFHAEGLRAGGADNGPPGLRPQYGPAYYAAFLVDPDGNRIEAVCKAPDAQ